MAEHLLGNVYQVGGGSITHELDGASYLVLDEVKGEHVLIDCGSPLGFENLERELDQFHIKFGSVAVYATHGHFDHVAAKAKSPNTPLYMHKGDIEAVLTGDPKRTATFLVDDQEFPEMANVETIEEGDEVVVGNSELSFLHLPGHSHGCVGIKIKTRRDGVLLVAGDTLWGAYHEYMGSDYDMWSDSLDKLSRDRFDYVTFGHSVTRAIPNAMDHIDYARSVFCKNIQVSLNGKFYDPWASVWIDNPQALTA